MLFRSDAHAVIRVEAWGDGADWLRDRALGLCARDKNEIVATGALRGHHAVVDAALRRFGILHLPSTGTPYHEVLPAILGQRITAAQALSQWVRLCERYGELAPGPLGLRLPPTPQALLRVASWEFHRLGIEEQRVRTLRIAARHAGYIDRTREMCGADARSALTKLDRKSTCLNSSHVSESRMPSSA